MNHRFMNLSIDSGLRGKILVRQPESGYRFSLDSILLADSLHPMPGDRIVDLGTGCGIISLIIAYRNRDVKLFGIEMQSVLAEIAHLNVVENQMTDRIKIHCEDLKNLHPDNFRGPFDLVVSNPPFIKAGTGRLGPDTEQSIARHEIEASLSDVLKSAYRLLKVSGKMAIIYPASRLVDLLYNLRCFKLEPKWLRQIQPKTNDPANRIIVHAVKEGRPGLKIESALIIYSPDGAYSHEVEQMFSP